MSSSTTPSRPAQAPLGGICGSSTAEVPPHLEQAGARRRINLDIAGGMEEGNPGAALQQVDRLHSVAHDVRQNGRDMLVLSIIGPAQYMVNERVEVVQEAAQVIPSILDAIAASGRPGGLILQELQLPVFGTCSIYTITRALSVCPELQRLSLLDSCSGQTTRASRQVLDKLPVAIGQLRQLKSLELQGGLFRYLEEPVRVLPAPFGVRLTMQLIDVWNLDGLLGSLPSSLENLIIDDYNQWHKRRRFSFNSSSMKHLVSLRRLTLPNHTTVSTEVQHTGGMADAPAAGSSSSASSGRGAAGGPCHHPATSSRGEVAAGGPCHHPASSSSRGEVAADSPCHHPASSSSRGEVAAGGPCMEVADSPCMGVEPSHYNHLADLTAVTYLACGSALHPTGRRLLAFPNLVELRAGHADDVLLDFLAQKPSLRSLGCLLDYPRCPAQATALSDLTQLTGLGLVLQQPHQVETFHAGAFLGGPPVQARAAERVGAALSSMIGLQKLRLEPQLLGLLDLRPLTALSSVAVIIRHVDSFEAGEAMAEAHLAPVRRRLRAVTFPRWPGVAGTLLGPA